MNLHFDCIIKNGTFFDGKGQPGLNRNIGIKDGRVVAISEAPLSEATAIRCIDAKDKWVIPGFIDFHTHYDGEIEVDAGLSESVRHGVTSVFLGSCSLGASLGKPEDIADIFCRVEGIPRSSFLPLLQEKKTWSTLTEYFEHLDGLNLGPNVGSFIPHSNLRMHTMGFSRSVQKGLRPSPAELEAQIRLLNEGLDAGYIGLSVQTLPWDKLDGDRERSKPLPSYFASWSEYDSLTKVLRNRGRVFQGVPNLVTKINVFKFLLSSAGLFRKPLRTTVISVVDLICDRKIWFLVPALSRFVNKFLGGDFKFQALPNPFDVWADGMDLVIFEEFAAGTEAMHLAHLGERSQLLKDPSYRKRFKKEWSALFSPRVYHRNFKHTTIKDCPDPELIGKSFYTLAKERGQDEIELFLDLCAEYGKDLRWYSVIGNDRLKPLEYITQHPDILIGFSDAGAHLRNMAFYNYPLRFLKLARDAHQRGDKFIPIEKAIHRLTGEVGDWFRIDAGILSEGSRADIAIIDPNGLDDALDETHEETIAAYGGMKRMVRRNPKAVPWVLINGHLAIENGIPTKDLGKIKMGHVIKAK